jgi:hypothetical protein
MTGGNKGNCPPPLDLKDIKIEKRRKYTKY